MIHNAVADMLEKYNCKNIDDHVNALKEIIQEIALLGLYRADFFNKAAFNGGTSLRILYGLDRFSEDFDFSLLKKDPDFDIEFYCKYIKDELSAYGFMMDVKRKHKSFKSNIESAFIKGETRINVMEISSLISDIYKLQKGKKIKVKFEVDISPPENAGYEIKYLLTPAPYYVRVFDLPSLFAGKIHAVLFRGWGNRIKGRDLYDFVWYLSKEITVNIKHLDERIKQSNALHKSPISIKDVKLLLKERFEEIDYKSAVDDILPFIENDIKLKLWSKDFFISITNERLQ